MQRERERESEIDVVLRFRVPGIELKNPSSPEIQKKKKTNSPPRVGPRKYEKIQNKYENGHFWVVFVFFLFFWGIFGARPGPGLSYFFRISGLEGFLRSIPGTRTCFSSAIRRNMSVCLSESVGVFVGQRREDSWGVPFPLSLLPFH